MLSVYACVWTWERGGNAENPNIDASNFFNKTKKKTLVSIEYVQNNVSNILVQVFENHTIKSIKEIWKENVLHKMFTQILKFDFHHND